MCSLQSTAPIGDQQQDCDSGRALVTNHVGPLSQFPLSRRRYNSHMAAGRTKSRWTSPSPAAARALCAKRFLLGPQFAAAGYGSVPFARPKKSPVSRTLLPTPAQGNVTRNAAAPLSSGALRATGRCSIRQNAPTSRSTGTPEERQYKWVGLDIRPDVA
jgi:hypothetical protein